MCFLSKQNLILNFCQKCFLSIKKHKNENRIHSDHPLKGNGRVCVPHFGPLMQFALEYATLGKAYFLKGHISRLSAQILMGFSVLHLQSCGQQFQTKNKISKCLVKKHVFKQNAKISGIPSLQHFIPAIVIIIEK